jgi:hypothetical protein
MLRLWAGHRPVSPVAATGRLFERVGPSSFVRFQAARPSSLWVFTRHLHASRPLDRLLPAAQLFVCCPSTLYHLLRLPCAPELISRECVVRLLSTSWQSPRAASITVRIRLPVRKAVRIGIWRCDSRPDVRSQLASAAASVRVVRIHRWPWW